MTLVAAALPGVKVVDGPPISKPSMKELVFVGYDPPSAASVIAQRIDEDLCGRMTETGEIACYIAVGRGDGNMSLTRARGVEILTAIEEAVRADKTGLSGGVDHAYVGPNMALEQYQTGQDAASIGLAFTVGYEAYI